jgi:hypothetical protein
MEERLGVTGPTLAPVYPASTRAFNRIEGRLDHIDGHVDRM